MWSQQRPGRFQLHLRLPPAGFCEVPRRAALQRRLVPVTQAPGGSECQVTSRVGWQLLGFSGMAKCGILATKGIFLLLDWIWFLTALMLNVAPTWAEPGHGCAGDVALASSCSAVATEGRSR